MLVELDKILEAVDKLPYGVFNRETIRNVVINAVKPVTQFVCAQCSGEWNEGERENHKFDCSTGKGGLTLKSLHKRLNRVETYLYARGMKPDDISSSKQNPTTEPW
jgi:hypothetical protein